MLSNSLVATRGLSRTFGAVQALSGVDIEIAEGEAVAIMGRSGSGKSTLLHLLGLLDTPTSGTLLLNGYDASELSDRERSQLRAQAIGFVFQAFHLIPQLDLLANVALPLFYHPNPPPDRERRARECLERVGLGDRTTHRPAQLSGGELQRAAIARAIVTRPQLILADEPTGNLDTETETTVLNYLQELQGDGITLIVITHDRDVAATCDRIITLQDGEVVA